jgi:hypothetical protein
MVDAKGKQSKSLDFRLRLMENATTCNNQAGFYFHILNDLKKW